MEIVIHKVCQKNKTTGAFKKLPPKLRSPMNPQRPAWGYFYDLNFRILFFEHALYDFFFIFCTFGTFISRSKWDLPKCSLSWVSERCCDQKWPCENLFCTLSWKWYYVIWLFKIDVSNPTTPHMCTLTTVIQFPRWLLIRFPRNSKIPSEKKNPN